MPSVDFGPIRPLRSGELEWAIDRDTGGFLWATKNPLATIARIIF